MENTQIQTTASKQIVISPQQKTRELLDKQKDQIARALPKFLTPDRFVRVALTTINKNPKLLECTQESLMACLMDCAQLGLEPDNVMGRAYLIPYNDTKNRRMVCQLQIGYKGLCDLAYRSGKVKSLMAQIVCERDSFTFQFGLSHRLDHVPYFGEEDRGKVTAVYAYAIMENGVTAFDVMGVDDVERVRKQSKSGDSGPWAGHWDEMARKTVLKRLSKYLPLSVEFMDAVAIDNLGETEPPMKAAKVTIPKPEALTAPSVDLPSDAPPQQPADTTLPALDQLSILMEDAGITFTQLKPIIQPAGLCARTAASPEDLSDVNLAKVIADWKEIADAVLKERAP